MPLLRPAATAYAGRPETGKSGRADIYIFRGPRVSSCTVTFFAGMTLPQLEDREGRAASRGVRKHLLALGWQWGDGP